MASLLSNQVEDWARGQCEGWLARLYGVSDDQDKDVKHLSPNSVQYQLVTVLSQLLIGAAATSESVAQTASLVVSHQYPDTAFANLLGMVLKAAEAIEDQTALQRLADWLVDLAHLPDAVNDTGDSKVIPETRLPDGSVGDRIIQPGELIELESGKLWRDLPGFAMNVTESTQGPEQYLVVHLGHDSPEVATAKWKNLNTFLAMIIAHPNARDVPVLARTTTAGFKMFVMALEYPRDREALAMHIPAAEQMMRIAGDTLGRIDGSTLYRWPAGPLWAQHANDDTSDFARFAFWRRRLALWAELDR